jgi:hypothetical protein
LSESLKKVHLELRSLRWRVKDISGDTCQLKKRTTSLEKEREMRDKREERSVIGNRDKKREQKGREKITRSVDTFFLFPLLSSLVRSEPERDFL